jgi:hypothetical protein
MFAYHRKVQASVHRRLPEHGDQRERRQSVRGQLRAGGVVGGAGAHGGQGGQQLRVSARQAPQRALRRRQTELRLAPLGQPRHLQATWTNVRVRADVRANRHRRHPRTTRHQAHLRMAGRLPRRAGESRVRIKDFFLY